MEKILAFLSLAFLSLVFFLVFRWGGVAYKLFLYSSKSPILTRMLVFVSKSHRKGLGKHGKNFKFLILTPLTL
ncbi:hypothetical protein Kyoto123A_07180 [Helicobacter pylori]